MYTPHPIGLQVSLDLFPGYGSSATSGSVSGLRRFQTRQVPRAPLHGSRCYLSRQGVLHPVSRRDSAFIAPTGSCANPKPSPRLGITLAHGVFTGCYQPRLGVGPFRVGEEVAPLTPHRPERAQLTHSVLRRTDSLTLRHSDGQSWAEVMGIFPISSRTRPTTPSSHSTCAITNSANTAVPDGLGRLCP